MQPQEQIDQSTAPETVVTQPVISKKSSGKNKLLILLVSMLLLLAVGGGIYYWQHQTVARVSKSNQDLANQLSNTKKTQPTQVSSQTTASDNKTSVSYKATVGKFTITLPSKYVVIEDRDGTGEGGAATSIKIGEATADSNIVKTGTEEVSINAYDIFSANNFRAYVDGELKDQSPQKQPSIKIDGVTAEVYLLGGIGRPKYIYFNKNTLFYRIILSDDTDSANQKLDALIKGFKFN